MIVASKEVNELATVPSQAAMPERWAVTMFPEPRSTENTFITFVQHLADVSNPWPTGRSHSQGAMYAA